jgi:hypothetical protein
MNRETERRPEIVCPECGATKAAEEPTCYRCANPEEADEARRLGGARGGRKRRYLSVAEAQLQPAALDDLAALLRGLGEVVSVLKTLDASPSVANSMISAYRVAGDLIMDKADRETIAQQIAELRQSIGLEP